MANCKDCVHCYVCLESDKDLTCKDFKDSSQFVELPPHSDLIDRDAVIEELRKLWIEDKQCSIGELMGIVNSIPCVIKEKYY